MGTPLFVRLGLGASPPLGPGSRDGVGGDATEAALRAVSDALDRTLPSPSARRDGPLVARVRLGVPLATIRVDLGQVERAVLERGLALDAGGIGVDPGGLCIDLAEGDGDEEVEDVVAGGGGGGGMAYCCVVACVTLGTAAPHLTLAEAAVARTQNGKKKRRSSAIAGAGAPVGSVLPPPVPPAASTGEAQRLALLRRIDALQAENQRLRRDGEDRTGEIELLQNRLALRDEALRTLGKENKEARTIGGSGGLRAAAAAVEGLRGLGMAAASVAAAASAHRHPNPIVGAPPPPPPPRSQHHLHNRGPGGVPTAVLGGGPLPSPPPPGPQHVPPGASQTPPLPAPPGHGPPHSRPPSHQGGLRAPPLPPAGGGGGGNGAATANPPSDLPPHLRRVTEMLSQSHLPTPMPFDVERHLGQQQQPPQHPLPPPLPPSRRNSSLDKSLEGASALSHLGAAAAAASAVSEGIITGKVPQAPPSPVMASRRNSMASLNGIAMSPSAESASNSSPGGSNLPQNAALGYQYRKLKPGKTSKNNDRQFVRHSYTDFSLEVSPGDEDALSDASGGAGKRGGNKGQAPSFPFKLHYLLDDVASMGQDDIITWLPHGRCFRVLKQKEFVEGVMPRYFQLSKYSSFLRQLNLYGFHRFSAGPDKGAYYHELFLRGMPFLARRMVRVRVNGNGIRSAGNPDAEPDFYVMPPVPYPPVRRHPQELQQLQQQVPPQQQHQMVHNGEGTAGEYQRDYSSDYTGQFANAG